MNIKHSTGLQKVAAERDCRTRGKNGMVERDGRLDGRIDGRIKWQRGTAELDFKCEMTQIGIVGYCYCYQS
jgi:hypothetical protein